MLAVMLRDMRSRYFNHGLGFLMVPLWPLAHIMVLLTIYNVMGRSTPYGNNLNIFFATGLVPTLTFMYVSRFMAVSVIQNRALMMFPVVKPIDVVMARALLECMGSVLTIIALFIVLIALGEDPVPFDVGEAVAAYLTIIMFAIGIGSLVSVIVMFMGWFLTIYFLMMVVVYASSGVLFVGSSLPRAISVPLSYSPVFQCVEWMRSAYFPAYSQHLLDRPYAVYCGMISLAVGLGVERLSRRKIYES